MLEGDSVNLRVMDKEDVPLVAGWRSDPEFQGEFNILIQESKAELQKRYEGFGPEEKWFLVERKDGRKVGMVVLEPRIGMQEIGFGIVPSERGKGYCTEAVRLIVDYLFLSTNIVRVQAHTDTRNTASQRVLEKTGFRKEGVVRKHVFTWGEWRDEFLYGILREEWKASKLTRTT